MGTHLRELNFLHFSSMDESSLSIEGRRYLMQLDFALNTQGWLGVYTMGEWKKEFSISMQVFLPSEPF